MQNPPLNKMDKIMDKTDNYFEGINDKYVDIKKFLLCENIDGRSASKIFIAL